MSPVQLEFNNLGSDCACSTMYGFGLKGTFVVVEVVLLVMQLTLTLTKDGVAHQKGLCSDRAALLLDA